jgi:hypothetical protein
MPVILTGDACGAWPDSKADAAAIEGLLRACTRPARWMALSCNGGPAGLANELWADVGYLLNALEQAERFVDELVACPPIVVELPRDLADEQAMVRALARIRDAGGTVRVLRCPRNCTCPTLLNGHHALSDGVTRPPQHAGNARWPHARAQIRIA